MGDKLKNNLTYYNVSCCSTTSLQISFSASCHSVSGCLNAPKSTIYLQMHTYTFPHFLFWKICVQQFISIFIQFDIDIHFMQRLANCVEVREKPGFRLCLHPFLVSDTTCSVSFQKHHEQATATILCFLPLMLTAIFLSLNYLLEALTNDKLVSIPAVLPKNHH